MLINYHFFMNRRIPCNILLVHGDFMFQDNETFIIFTRTLEYQSLKYYNCQDLFLQLCTSALQSFIICRNS